MASTTLVSRHESPLYKSHTFCPALTLSLTWEPTPAHPTPLEGTEAVVYADSLSLGDQQVFLAELRDLKQKLYHIATVGLNSPHPIKHEAVPPFAFDLQGDDVRLAPQPLIRAKVRDDDIRKIRAKGDKIVSIKWTMTHTVLRETLASSRNLGASQGPNGRELVALYELSAEIEEFKPDEEVVKTIVL